MNKLMIVLISIAVLLNGCAGSTPRPIPQYQQGDDDMGCSQIKLEIADNNTKIMNLIPKEQKTGKNVALGVAGAFFIVPWFFMDFSDAERVEVQSYQLRNNWLTTLAQKKHCGSTPARVRFSGQ